MAETIYDQEDKEKEPIKKPASQDGSHDDLGYSPDERQAEIADLEKDFAAPAASEGGEKSLASDELESAESSAGDSDTPSDQAGKGYTPGPKSKTDSLKNIMTGLSKRKGFWAGGGIAVAIAGLLVTAFLALLPLKILHIVENLQSRFFATSENAVQNETQALMSGYLKKYVIPSLSKCGGSTIDKNCNPIIGTGDNPVLAVYRGWKQAKLENVLADKYGIEFKKVGNKYYMKTPSLPDTGDGITKDGKDISGFVDVHNQTDYQGDLFKQVNRNEVRQEVRTAMSKETKWKQVMYRFKVGRLLERKYGIKRCLIFCKTKDKAADWRDAKTNELKSKTIAKVFLSERVLGPRAESLGLVLQCVIEQSCDPQKRVDNDGPNGESRSKFDRDLQAQLDKLAEKYGQQAVEKVIADANLILEEGFTKYAVRKITADVVSHFTADAATQEQTANAAADAIPVVNAINIASQAINAMTKAGPKIKYLAYAAGSASMIKLYMNYRTEADECKSGHCDAAILGSFTDTLAPNQHKNSDGTMSGVGAEGAPLYSELFGNGSTTTTAFMDNFLPAKAEAASNLSQYTCDNGKGVPAGKLICPEEDLRQSNFFNGISDAFSQPPLSILSKAAELWGKVVHGLTGWVSNILGSLISNFPGVSQLSDAVSKIIQPIFTAIAQYLIPSPISENMSGGRTVNMMIGGADAAGSDFAHHGLGGRVLSGQEATAIVNEQQQQAQEDFKQSSFFARMFNKDSSYSLVSRVAMAMPTSLNTALSTGFANLLHNPFSTLMNSFASFLNPGRAMAAANADMCTDGGPFGVTCYGYTDSEIPQDPETYWDQHCRGSQTLRWNQAAVKTTNPDTGQFENHTTDPCLLIQATVGSAGGIYSDSTLTADDLSGSNPDDGSTTSTPVTGKVYMIGDSLTEGMKTGGNLEQKLTSAGLTATKIEDTVGINVANSIPKLQADSSQVASAKTIIIELGTNNCSLGGTPSCLSTPQFEQQISYMIGAVRAINPSAAIYWVNIYTTKGPVYQSINQAIANQSTAYKFKVIDWAKEVTSNPGKYSFDSQLGVHQTSATGYSNMAQFVVGALR